ncbi:MAG TPA: ABC transporter permease [Blastocatellia bacterium]|nr:ABC transporter permease [Blastocatellia bacterium]
MNSTAIETPPDQASERADAAKEATHHRQAQTVPKHPLIRIRPSQRWVSLNLADLWAYRELLYFLTLRDVKVRYKQTALGAAWAIIQPLFTMLVFTLFFGRLAGVPSEGVPYSIFAYAGLLPWTFFSNAVTNSGNSLVASANLITKVYFPRIIIPGAAVLAGLVDFAIAFAIQALLMIYHGVEVTWNILMLPVLVLLTALLALGVGMLMSALNVKYRDIRYALPFVVQLWMFASPIIYPSSLVPDRWRWVMSLNPLTGIIEGYRSALFGRDFDTLGLFISALITLALLVYSSFVFRRMEKSFADLV